MKIAMYLETYGAGLGGAEYSACVLASSLAKVHDVSLVHHHKDISHEKLSECFDEDLSNVTLRYAECDLNWLNPGWKESFSKDTDCFISICHWVPPVCHAPHGILYVLFPFFDRPKQWPWSAGNGIKSLLRRRKYNGEWNRRIRSYQNVVSISEYTRHWTKKWWNTDSDVIYPPVDVDFPERIRENRIVALGRFCQMKRQLEMIHGLRGLVASNSLGDWRMSCCGNPFDTEYYQQLQQVAAGLPVDFVLGADRDEIKRRLAGSKVFWHAAGYGIDEHALPAKLEHFGIVTVEAMAAGCVPIVFGKGGQAEIVEHGINGFHWQSLEELQYFTSRIINDEELRRNMSQAAQKRAKHFSKHRFVEEFQSLVEPTTVTFSGKC